jgi:hypothetical protein
MVIAIFPACKLLGIAGGQVAALLAIIVSYLIQIFRMRSLTGLDLLRYGRAFVPATLVTVGILAAGYGVHVLGLATSPAVTLTLGAAACMIAYALCVPAFMRARHTA